MSWSDGGVAISDGATMEACEAVSTHHKTYQTIIMMIRSPPTDAQICRIHLRLAVTSVSAEAAEGYIILYYYISLVNSPRGRPAPPHRRPRSATSLYGVVVLGCIVPLTVQPCLFCTG
eukprot:COSAG01_NODE_5218_length_4404_cov_33.696400_4_plen_118_part_00